MNTTSPTYTKGQTIQYAIAGARRSRRITLRYDATVNERGYITLAGWRTRLDGVMLGDGHWSDYVRLEWTKPYTVFVTHKAI